MITAKLRNLHIAPRKVRLVVDIVRGKTAAEAGAILNFTTKKAALPILKLLNSAMANARNNFQLDPDNLYISRITVDEGPKIKRFMPRARGSANEIQKKTSHINLSLDEIKKSLPADRQGAGKIKEKAAPEGGEPRPVKAGREEKPKLKSEAKISVPKIEKPAKRIFRRQVF